MKLIESQSSMSTLKDLESVAAICAAPEPSRFVGLRELRRWNRHRSILAAILLVAFALRIAWRVHKGNQDFWSHGYLFFYELGRNLIHRHEFTIYGLRAMRVPLYPLFLGLTSLGGPYYLWVAIPQALVGAGTVCCTYLIGRDLLGMRQGLVAAAIAAVYPYYVVHDTALQETSLLTFVTATAMLLLLRAMRSRSWYMWLSAGTILGVAVLTRQTLLPFAIAAPIWIALFSEGRRQDRLARAGAVVLPLMVLVGGWMARNNAILGAPLITSEFGRQLWNGNNPKTFSHYPRQSIDLSQTEAWDAMTPDEQREVDRISVNEAAESDWFLQKGLNYVTNHPGETLLNGARKVSIAFSLRFSPDRPWPEEAVYALSYGPAAILGVVGMWITRKRWRQLGLVYLLFLSFALVTAVFFAHTSHRSYLDLYWIVLAVNAACAVPAGASRTAVNLKGYTRRLSGP